MKKVVAISGSPKKDGTTETLLSIALEEIRKKGVEPEYLRIYSLAISPCTDCGSCDTTGECNITDGMNYIYNSFKEADAILLVSPIFFSSLPSQVKAFVDRFQSWWASKEKLFREVRKKPGKIAFIAVGGRNSQKDFECAKRPIRALSIVANLVWAGDAYFPGMDTPSDLPPRKIIREKISPILDNLLE